MLMAGDPEDSRGPRTSTCLLPTPTSYGPLAGRPQRQGRAEHGPSRPQTASPLQLKLLLIHRDLGRWVGARPGVGQGFPDSYLR